MRTYSWISLRVAAALLLMLSLLPASVHRAQAQHLIAWGSNNYGDVSNTPKTGTYIAVAAGNEFNVAVRSDGSLVAWGNDNFGQVSNAPTTGTYIAVAAGNHFAVALRSDGSLVAWGNDNFGQVSNAPTTGTYTAVAAGSDFSVALRSDGSLVSWGNNGSGQVSNTPTSGSYIAIAPGYNFSVAIRSNGSLVSWGSNDRGQISGTPKIGSYQALGTGNQNHFGMAIRSDGSLVVWGNDSDGEVSRTPKTGTYSAAAAGNYFVIALGDRPPVVVASVDGLMPDLPGVYQISIPHDGNPNTSTASITLDGSATSDPDGDPLTYEWLLLTPTPLPLGNTPTLPLTLHAGAYVFELDVTDSFGMPAPPIQMTVNVRPEPNRAPIADKQSVSLNQDTPTPITLTGSDPEGDSIIFALLSFPAHGSLSGTLSNLTYTPDTGYTGTDSFTFLTVDSYGAAGNTATVSLTVNPASPSLINTAVSVADISGQAGQSVTLSAVLRRTDTNAVLPGRSLNFYVNNTYVGTVSTDLAGTAQTSYTIPSNLNSGAQLNLTVKRLANSQFAASTGTGTLTVAAVDTAVAVANVSGQAGQAVTLKAILTRTSDNAVLPGRSLSFYVNNAYVGTVNTDGTGTASVNYTILSNLSAGTQLTITVKRLANSQYNASTGTATLTVSP